MNRAKRWLPTGRQALEGFGGGIIFGCGAWASDTGSFAPFLVAFIGWAMIRAAHNIPLTSELERP